VIASPGVAVTQYGVDRELAVVAGRSLVVLVPDTGHRIPVKLTLMLIIIMMRRVVLQGRGQP